jgi:PAS domain S-box-containing protein
MPNTSTALIRKSEQRLQLALRAGRMFVTEVDLKTGALSLSESASEILGLPAGIQPEDAATLLRRFVHPDDVAKVSTVMQRAMVDGVVENLEYRLILENGALLWVERRGIIEHDEEGRPNRLTSVLVDITDRKAADEALRVSEARYRVMFEQAPEAIVTFDLDARGFVEVNDNALRLFGYPRDALFSIDPSILSPPFQPDGRVSGEASRMYTDALRAGAPQYFEWEYRHASGRDIPCEVRVTRLPSLGNFLARMSIVDISERRHAERFRQRAAELELENQRVQQANRLKSEFLASMSHELRTPLNAIIGFSELLHDGEVDPQSAEFTEFLADILASGKHLLGLINDVLDLAKVESGKLDFSAEPVDLGALAREVCTILKSLSAPKRIRVQLEVDPTLTDVHADPSRFKQVLYNYLSNALKFTPQGGSVSVRIQALDQQQFRLEVEDSGVGISRSNLTKLFLEFQQIHEPGSRQSGTGLGLALTRRLVEAQGGSVGVESERGRGSRFHAILPRHLSTPNEVSGVVGASVPPSAVSPTVLVADSEEDVRARIEETLTHAGYTVETASSGEQAIVETTRRLFDAITVGVAMSDMPGVVLIEQIKSGKKNRETPVILITRTGLERPIGGVAVHDVITLPFDAEALLASLARAEQTRVRPRVLVVDDDLSSLRLVDRALSSRGFDPLLCTDAARGIEVLVDLHPGAIILDLLMPGMSGFEFLDHLRRLPGHEKTPVLVWTMKDLIADEIIRLRATTQAIIPKTGGRLSTLLTELAQVVSPPRWATSQRDERLSERSR